MWHYHSAYFFPYLCNCFDITGIFHKLINICLVTEEEVTLYSTSMAHSSWLLVGKSKQPINSIHYFPITLWVIKSAMCYLYMSCISPWLIPLGRQGRHFLSPNLKTGRKDVLFVLEESAWIQPYSYEQGNFLHIISAWMCIHKVYLYSSKACIRLV